MNKKTKKTLIGLSILFIIAAIISVVQMVMDGKVNGLQTGNVLALAIIGVAAAFALIHDKSGKGDDK